MIIKNDRHLRDGIHKGNVDLDGLCYQILDFSEHREIVFGLDVFWICGVEACHQPAKWGDANSFANTQNGYEDPCKPS